MGTDPDAHGVASVMHLAFPNVRRDSHGRPQFWGCVRWRSLSAGTPALGEPYGRTTELRGLDDAIVDMAIEILVPEWRAQGYTVELYHIADEGLKYWQGPSMAFTYLLAAIRCARPLALTTVGNLGDVWCTGALGQLAPNGQDIPVTTPILKAVTPAEFQAKLAGFCTQPQDRLFFVPSSNITDEEKALCEKHGVQVLSFAGFRERLHTARGGWTEPPAVIRVGTLELGRLVATLFQPPAHQPGKGTGGEEDRRLPYKFLDSFGPADAEIFSGRDGDIARLQREFYASRCLILFGASGTGKTSLVQAGLLPSLPAERYAWVPVRLLDAHPTDAIKAALANEWGVDQQTKPLHEAIRAATTTLGKAVVIVLDRGEELFQHHARTVRQQFARDLGKCLDTASLDVHVLITVREDYYHRLGEFQDLIPTIFHHIMYVTRLTPEQAVAAVVEPAQQRGWHIDETLVEEVLVPQLVKMAQERATPLADEDACIEPPLVQIVCHALAQHAAQAHRTTIGAQDYAALGDIRTILGRYLETTLQQFGAEQRQARAILKAMVTAQRTTWAGFLEELRSRVRTTFLEELRSRVRTARVPLTADLEGFLRRLVQARLVRATNVEGRTRYELLHDYLAAHIAEWITDQERELTKVLEAIDRAYEVWQETELLLEERALQWIALYEDQLNLSAAHKRFLDQSKDAAAQREQEAERQQRRRVWRRVGAAVLAVVLGLGSIFGWRLSQAYQQARHQLAALYAEQGRQELFQGRAPRAAVYLSEAYQMGEAEPSLRFLLAQALQRLEAYLSLEGHTKGVRSAAFSPDGTWVVTASLDGTARVWEASSGQLQATHTGHTNMVYSAAFSPDGTRVVTASADNTARVWEASSGQLQATLTGHTKEVRSAAFSPDGTRVVTASLDGTARVWQASSGQLQATLTGHRDTVHSAAFNPEGTRVITASDDGTARVWQASSGQLQGILTGHTKGVHSAAFNPDGMWVVTASADGTARVWQASSGQPQAILTGHTDWVISAAFSPDGTRVVTASADKTARVWQASSWKLQVTLTGHTNGVNSAAFSPDGTRVVTGSADNTARVWEASSGQLQATLTGHTSVVNSAAFSPDSTRVVTASGDNTARVWEASSGQLQATLTGHRDTVHSAAFSPDGIWVVTASLDGTARVWEASSGQLQGILTGHTSAVMSAAFSPDGTQVVTASTDKTARVWAVRLETRGPTEIAALVRCKVPWRLVAGQLFPTPPDSTCARHTLRPHELPDRQVGRSNKS